ncbi:MAG: hypothetical protein ACOCYC_01615 [bacterium]
MGAHSLDRHQRWGEAAVPYTANIHGAQVTDVLPAADMPQPNTLSEVTVETSSDHPFLAGNGRIILHSGYPNGIVYFYFHHSTGFTTYMYQFSGSSGSMGDFFGPMENELWWTFFPTGDGPPEHGFPD